MKWKHSKKKNLTTHATFYDVIKQLYTSLTLIPICIFIDDSTNKTRKSLNKKDSGQKSSSSNPAIKLSHEKF